MTQIRKGMAHSFFHAMTRNNNPAPTSTAEGADAARFRAVRDYRNRKVKGLQERNGRFYAQLWVLQESGKKTARRFPLFDENRAPCRSLTDAQEAFEKLKQDRRTGALPSSGRKPGLKAAVLEYLESVGHQSKAQNTREKEVRSLDLWVRFLGWETRLDSISTQMISSFKTKRLAGGTIGGRHRKAAHPRTVEHDLVALRNFLQFAVDEKKWITKKPDFPKWGRKAIPKPRKRALIEPEKFLQLIQCCRARHEGVLGDQVLTIRNGEQLADFLLLLAYTGAREQEGLKLRWSHVDFTRRCLHIGAGEDFVSGTVVLGIAGDTKTGRGRQVQFNPQLEAHLVDMKSRRAPDSEWLFPSPRRGKKDLRVTTLRSSLESALKAAGIDRLGFHDMRHLFISSCLMGGTDVGTVASWVGHVDGGKLIMQTYSHLLDDHLHEAAAKVQVGFSVVPPSFLPTNSGHG